jgi:uncharacterized protein (DUF952 family)
MIYHVANIAAWDAAQETKQYIHPSLAAEGFIHACSKEQLRGVLDRYYKNVTDIVLLEIDESKLTNPLKYELAPSVNEMFPHCFGYINTDAVVSVQPFESFAHK